MSVSLSVATGGAISCDGKSTAENSLQTTNGLSAVDDEGWFGAAPRQLYPVKAGTVLYLTTGLGDERLCQRYAAGTVKPSAYFLRNLLRGDHGEQWLNATLEGLDKEWWLQLGALRQLSSDYIVRKR